MSFKYAIIVENAFTHFISKQTNKQMLHIHVHNINHCSFLFFNDIVKEFNVYLIFTPETENLMDLL